MTFTRAIGVACNKVIVLIVLWSRQTDIEPLIVEELLYADDPETAH